MVDGMETGSFLETEKGSHEPNEVALIKLAQEGNQRAFARLCSDHYSKIIQYLIPRVGCDNADDVAQETFIRAWKRLPDLRVPMLFTHWLRRIARNCAYDYLRGQQKRGSQIPLDDVPTAGGDIDTLSIPGPEEGVEQRELIELALNQVTPIYRACLLLYVREGLSQRKVAEQLNIKDTSIGNYLSRGP
jgi:RNA polymerase sigma-70 factor (ECF subfamily)